MKTLVINGSPNKHGIVAIMLKRAVEKLPPEDVRWVHAYELDMQYCKGCMKCRSTGKCVLPEDDAHWVGEQIRFASNLIIGTPTHWANMSVPLKMLFDRNVPVFMEKNSKGIPVPKQKGKKSIILTACNAPWPVNIAGNESRGAIRSIKHILKMGGYQILGSTAIPSSDKITALSQKKIKRLHHLGRKMASYHIQ